MTLRLHEGMGWEESVLILNVSAPRCHIMQGIQWVVVTSQGRDEGSVVVDAHVSELAAFCSFSQKPP